MLRNARTVGVVATLAIGCASHVVSSDRNAELAEAGGAGGVLSPVSGGAPSLSNGAASNGGSSGSVVPGPGETPGTGPFQGLGTGGAPAAGEGGSAPAGAGGQPNEGGTANGGSGPTPPAARKLRDTAPGDAVVFDPDEVYAVGYVSDGDQYIGPYGIAPLADTSDTVSAIPLFAHEFIRRTDGHLLYSYLGADSNGLGRTEPLYEFRRDEVDLAHMTNGETSLADVVAACSTAPRGTSGQANNPGQYGVGFDGGVYYGCYEDNWPSTSSLAWYRAPQTPLTFAPESIHSIGPDDRVLIGTDGMYGVMNLKDGTVLAIHDMQVPFGGYALATRSHANGFWLAGGAFQYQDVFTMQWVELDWSGAIASSGVYPPLPPSITLDENNWTAKHPVLDGRGALYQFAWEGSDAVIVRRPISGDPYVYYRSSSYDITHPHQVMPDYLVTGQ